jgi:hypothetical protein
LIWLKLKSNKANKRLQSVNKRTRTTACNVSCRVLQVVAHCLVAMAFPNVGMAIIWKCTDSAGGIQALENSTLVYTPLRGATVS